MQPIIAVPTDVRIFDNYTWHASAQQYLDAAINIAAVMPILIPSLADKIDMDSLLDRVDGIMLTGSKTNVHPSLYGGKATAADAPFDELRDSTTIPLIQRAVERNIPILAICRGLQELNVALGGTLMSEIQQRPGALDHRVPTSELADERFSIRHSVHLFPGCLSSIVSSDSVKINSLHRQAIDRCADKLNIDAIAEDNTIEAVSVLGADFALGVQWHPEYWVTSDKTSYEIFAAFGKAVHEYHLRKQPTL